MRDHIYDAPIRFGISISDAERPDPHMPTRHAVLKLFKGTHVVYAIRVKGGVIKIGHTTNVDWRVYQLKGKILAFRFGTLEDELAIHASLSDESRHHAREWYNPTPEVLA